MQIRILRKHTACLFLMCLISGAVGICGQASGATLSKPHSVIKNDAFILFVAFTRDGTKLLGPSGHVIEIWDSTSLKNVSELRKIGPGWGANIARVIACAPRGHEVAVGYQGMGANGEVQKFSLLMWDLSTQKVVREFVGHTSRVSGLAWSPTADLLASSDSSGCVKFWQASTGKLLLSVQPPNIETTEKYFSTEAGSLAFSPNGKVLAVGRCDHSALLMDPQTGEVKATLKNNGEVNSVAFSPDGKILACGLSDYNIVLWDVVTGKELRRLTGHQETVNAVAFSPDGKTLASASGSNTSHDDNTVRLWDVASGKEIAKLGGYTELVLAVAFSPDGKRLATGGWDSRIVLWDVPSLLRQ